MVKKYNKSIINYKFIIYSVVFSIFTSFISIIYLLGKDSTLGVFIPDYLYKLSVLLNIKTIILSCWLISSILLILLIVFYFINKQSNKDEAIIAGILKKYNNSDKLISFVITDNWGNLFWASDLFKQIFNIENHEDLTIIQILSSSHYIECNSNNINTIQSHLKHKQSGFVDLSIKVARVDSVFRLSFLLIGNIYIWQIMLIDSKKSEKDSDYENLIKDIPTAVAIHTKLGKVLAVNNLFKRTFTNSSFKYINIFDDFNTKLSLDNSLSSNVFYNHIKFREEKENIDTDVIVLSCLVKQDKEKSYIKSLFIPLGHKSFNIDVLNNYLTNVSYFEKIYAETPVGALLLNEKDIILCANPSIKKLLNKDDNIVNVSLYDIFSVDISYLKKQIQVDYNQTVNIEEEIDNKYYKIIISYLSKNIRILNLQDITEQKKLEVEVKHSQGLQTVGQIASVVAHDFNNLLTAIMSFTYFAQERQEQNDPVYAELEQIKQNANKAKIMIRQLLTFSRKQDLNPVSFDINSEISDLMSTILRLMGDKVKPVFKRGKNAGNVIMDKVQLHQVITNLVVNARDAMKSGDTLEIYTSSLNLKTAKYGLLDTIPEGKYVCIEIKDKGTGIKEENLKLIFKPHFSTKGDKGNGLGLDTVYKIISDSAGFIDVKTKIGKGTSFYLYLPKDESSSSASINTKTSTTTKTEEVFEQQSILDLTGEETVLFVEDEAPVRMVCSRLLRNKGYNVIEASGGTEALDYLENNAVKTLDLVISDVMMPDLNGPELVGRVRDKFPNIKALLISGYTEDVLDDIVSDVSLKGIEFLPKPFTPDVFATRVRNILSEDKGCV